MAIKDPTVVWLEDRYQVYASSVSASGAYNMVHTSFRDFEQAPHAPLYAMSETPGFDTYVAAPQLFFFRPAQKWYLVFQSGPPMFAISDDPSDPRSWSKPQAFFGATPELIRRCGGWLDFWVIADDEQCHLFFSNDDGRLYKSTTTLEDFPRRFGEPRVVLEDPEPGRIYEACNVYRLKDTHSYLALVEAFDRSSGGRRYFRSWLALRLDGPWTPLHEDAGQPFAGAENVRFEGARWTLDISHGELIRDICDETLTLDPHNLRLLYQGFEPQADTSNYNAIPWKLGLLQLAP